MNTLPITRCAMLAMVLCVPATVALAEKGERHRQNVVTPIFAQGIVIGINSGDRVRIGDFMREEHQNNCPPGLAKKKNDCLPPGKAKKYKVGSVYDGPWSPIPDELAIRLSGAPAGYQYVMVDKDVLLIAEATKQVMDAVTLLSALGR